GAPEGAAGPWMQSCIMSAIDTEEDAMTTSPNTAPRLMRAAWYERKGPAREVLQVGQLALPEPGAGEVRVRVHVSGINPSDTKGRGVWAGNTTMLFPRIVPHQDGAGAIDAVGVDVPPS